MKTTQREEVTKVPGAANGLQELLVEGLKDIYWAEKAIIKALPKMISHATSEELVEAFTEHLEVTRQQATRLESVFASLSEKAVAKKCDAMDGLIAEAEELIDSTKKGVVLDAGLILAAQKIEHYEIATYGTLAAFAKTLGEYEAAEMLLESLSEEKESDANLSDIAESSINIEASEVDIEA